MKKKLSLLLILLLLAGCGGENNTSKSDDTGNIGTKIVKVWVHKSSEEPEGKVYKQLQSLFNSQEITNSKGQRLVISMEFYGSTLETKINGALLTNGLPDVIAVDSSDITAKAYNEILKDITSYVSETEKDSYIDSVIEASTIDGKLYALGAMEAPGGLYYNIDLLKSVGINDFGTLENPWSWTDVMDAMKILKENNKAYQIKLNFGFGTDGYMYLYSPLVYSAGGSFGSDDHVKEALTSEKSVAGIKQIEQFFSTKGLGNGESWVYSGSKETAFAEEEIAFEIYGPWNVRTIENENLKVKGHYDIMPYPVYEDEKGNKSNIVATPCGSYEFGVTTHTKDVESAATVVKFLTNADSSKMLYDAIGTYPTHKSLLQNESLFGSDAAKSLAEYLLNNTYTRPKMIKYPQLKNAYQEILSYIKNKDMVSKYNLEAKIQSESEIVDNARG